MKQIAVSPCSNPKMSLEEVLKAYSTIGYKKLELFTSWAKSSVDYKADPRMYLEMAEYYGMKYTALHLPSIDINVEQTMEVAIEAAHFAAELGVNIVLFKAKSIELYKETAKAFLDATEQLQFTAVLQNHAGTAISTLRDYDKVLNGINDPRMKALLEVGHFHTVGVHWREGYELLGSLTAHIHIKDQIGGQSVPFGTGEIDIRSIFEFMNKVGYVGDYVVEMEAADHENTLEYLADALTFLRKMEL